MRARHHARPVLTRAALAGALGLALFACGTKGPTDPLDGERDRLEQARGQWRSQGITDYRFTFRRACFCVPASLEPALVTVRRGTIVSVEREADGTPLDPALYFTIEGLFDLLADSIDQGADRLSASYDSALGYPTSAFIDRNFMIADEELGFQVSDLRPLRP